MEKHTTLLAALFLALGIMSLIGMLVVVVVFGAGSAAIGAAAANDPDVSAPLALIPLGIGLFIVLAIAFTAIPNLIAAYGLFTRRTWARVFSLIAAILNLPLFPLGTGVGIYGIWYFLQLQEDASGVLPQ